MVIDIVRSRLFLHLLGAAVLASLPMLAAMVHQVSVHRAHALESGQQLLLRVSEQVATDLRSVLQTAEETLQYVVSLPAVEQSDWAACQSALAVLHSSSTRLAFLGVVDERGALVCGSLPFDAGTSAADRAWFRNARESLGFAVGDYAIGRVSDRPSIHLAYPVIRNGAFAGAANLALDVDWLANRLAAHVPDGKVVTYILDSGGRLIARNSPVGPPVGAVLGLPLEAAPRQSAHALIETTELDGVERIVRLQPLIDASGGSLWGAVGIERALLTGPANQAFRSALIVFGLSLLLAIGLLCAGLARLVVVPIKALGDAAHRLKSGAAVELPQPPQIGNEIDALTASFSDMATKVAAREADRQELERRDALLREVSHRVKNHLSSLASMAQLERRNAAPEARRYLVAMHQRIMAMAELYDLLAQRPLVGEVSLAAYVERVCAQLMHAVGRDGIVLRVDTAGDVTVGPERAMAIGLFLNEVLTNALKHAFPSNEGQIDVHLDVSGPTIELKVSDNGIGLAPEAAADGLGMRIIKSMAAQIDGELVVERHGGTSFSLSFPAGRRSSPAAAVIAAEPSKLPPVSGMTAVLTLH